MAIHVVSVSGGKDSTATSLHLTERGIEHLRVFADTGWELPETYEYIKDVLEPKLGPIVTLRPPKNMEELILHKGMFPSRKIRFCTQKLKFEPIKRYLAGLGDELDDEIINVIGVRADESRARSRLPEREYDPGMGLEVWRPIIKWTMQDVWDCHTRHGIKPNPLYYKGFGRVGCAPCIMARKAELRILAREYPEQIERIRALEKTIQDSGKANKEGNPPTFFQMPLRDKDGKRPCVPIDTIIDWSKTSRGGRQFELFVPTHDPCKKWGLCDAGSGIDPTS